MRIYVDARYARHLKAEIILLVAKIGNDKAWREEEDPRVSAWANIPADRIDADAKGEVLIVIDEPDAGADVVRFPDQLKVAS